MPAPIEVWAAYTSQTCAKCGKTTKENRPKKDAAGKSIQDVFHCVSCNYETNADLNASEVIALRALFRQEKGGKLLKLEEFSQWLKTMGQDNSDSKRV